MLPAGLFNVYINYYALYLYSKEIQFYISFSESGLPCVLSLSFCCSAALFIYLSIAPVSCVCLKVWQLWELNIELTQCVLYLHSARFTCVYLDATKSLPHPHLLPLLLSPCWRLVPKISFLNTFHTCRKTLYCM